MSLRGVAKRFGSLQVLEGIDLKAGGGELLGLIGPNGAGKTTLMRCVADGAERSAGEVELCGRTIRREGPAFCVRAGLGRKFQNANIFDSMTVAESLRIASAIRERPSWLRRAPELRLPPYALEVLRMTELDQCLDRPARDLSHGQQQALELAMVLALEPRVVLLDEPTAGLSRPSAPASARCCPAVAALRAVLPAGRARPGFRGRGGHAHRGAAPGAHRDGRQFPGGGGVGAGARHLRQRAGGGRGGAAMSMQANGLAKADGRVGAGGQASRPGPGGRVQRPSRRWCCATCRWRWNPGRVALLGKNGMGKSTLLKTVMGYLPKAGGRVRLGGADATRMRPQDVARHGVAYAAQEQALFPDLSIRDNLRLGLPSDRLFDERFADVAQLFPVFASRLRQHAGTLSGGEQKMLLVARGLMQRPALLLLDEITEGLQPSVIDRLAGALAWERERRGTSMFIVEQNVAFALKVADRYLILKQGAIVDQGEAGAAGAAGHIIDHLKV